MFCHDPAAVLQAYPRHQIRHTVVFVLLLCAVVTQSPHASPSAFHIAVVQMLEVGYMIYQGRYFYPVLIVLIFFIAAVGLVVTLQRQRKKIMAMVNECRLTPIIWEGWVRAVSSHRLLPGDVLVLQQGKALCDMVVLQGSCLVMESMLSGEVGHLRAQQLNQMSLLG